MRVLHVVPSFYPAVGYGGPIHSLLHLCLNLKGLGCEVKVLTTDAHRDFRLTLNQQRDPLLSTLKVQFCRRIGRGTIAPQLLRRLSEEIAWADVIHLTAVYNFPTLPTLFAARQSGKPLVWSPRGTLQRWAGSRHVLAKAFWEFTCRMLLPRRTALHLTSEEEAAESAPRLGNPTAWVIPNGVDIPLLPTPPPNDGVLKLLFIGRLDPKKGIENLIEATSIFSRLKLADWRLRIAGEGDPDYVAGLHALASDAGVSSRVEFCGHLDGECKHRAFANSDIVVVPSHTENFGLVVAEALAHARPVIAGRGTPWREVESRGCGLWVNNDPPSLASGIQKLCRCDRAAMGRRGRDWMNSSFTWQERARCMLSLYERLVCA